MTLFSLSPKRRISVLLVCLAMLFSSVLPVAAQTAPATPLPASPIGLTVSEQQNGLQFSWDGEVSAASLLHSWPTVRFQGYDLPLQLVSVWMTDRTALDSIAIQELAWQELPEQTILPAAPLVPQLLPEVGESIPTATEEMIALPTKPLFIIRAGWIDGQARAVVAFSPIYSDNGKTKLVTRLHASAPGLLSQQAASASAGQALASTIPNTPPTNPVVGSSAVKVIVSQPGIQQVTAATLAAAGIDMRSINVAKLHIMRNGVEIAYQVLADEIRFYTPFVGDRWNETETYWISLEADNGLQMASRSAAPTTNVPTRSDVTLKGTWRNNTLYDSVAAGSDGDHWFSSLLDLDGTTTNYPKDLTVTLPTLLPLTGGTADFRINASPTPRNASGLKCTALELQTTYGDQVNAININIDEGKLFLDGNVTKNVTSTLQSNLFKLSLVDAMPGGCGLRLDSIDWAQQGILDIGGKGLTFTGVPGSWQYAWRNAPSDPSDSLRRPTLYDVTTPETPVALTGVNATGFRDGPEAHDYILVGPETLQTPRVVAHQPTVFHAEPGAHAIYIAPSVLQGVLTPLVEHRRSQGYQVAVVDPQSIYDAWSYGQVAPQAIRMFLQFAYSNWNPRPLAVVLVGDGTIDPHDYEGRNTNKYHNFIPPYLAEDVDPWLKEAACENCFVQLNGEDPITGDTFVGGGKVFDIDMWIGRLPVKSALELQKLAAKIIAYESDADVNALWRGTTVYVADNHIRQVENGKPIYDQAGDFVTLSEDVIAFQPVRSLVKRLYYDPFPQFHDPTGNNPWRIADGLTMKVNVLSTVSEGAGLVTYSGHANHWNMGGMEQSKDPAYILGLYDVDTFSNADRYFIQMSMTCLTSQFAKPATAGTTIDERILLNPNGGAIAVWGPAGLSVAHGHDQLQNGFHEALWNAPPLTASIGQLVETGYQKLLSNEICCQDALQTFLLLGDPLTTARVRPIGLTWAPLIQNTNN